MGRPAKYLEEFREPAVAMVRETGKSIVEVARDLRINDGMRGNWVKPTGVVAVNSDRLS